MFLYKKMRRLNEGDDYTDIMGKGCFKYGTAFLVVIIFVFGRNLKEVI